MQNFKKCNITRAQKFLRGAQGVLQFPVSKNYTLTPA